MTRIRSRQRRSKRPSFRRTGREIGRNVGQKTSGGLIGPRFCGRRRGTWIDRAIARDCRHADARRLALSAAPAARAVEAVNVRLDAPAIDLTAATELQKTDTDRIQVSTAPGADGIVRRIEVRAREGGTNWAVFALTNNSDEQIDRLIVVPHYRMVGSGLFWPDLGLSRIATITPSTGDRPVRQEADDRRHFPRHARSRHRHHLRRRIAHRQAAADLSVGAGRLQGQGQLLHALLRHRHRHRRPAGAVPHHPVRGQGLDDVSRPPPRSAGRC